jgi:hypothetical protein
VTTLGVTAAELRAMAEHAAASAFLPPAARDQLVGRVQAGWGQALTS